MHNPPPSTVKPLIFGSRGHGYIALAVNAAFLALLSYWLSQNVNCSDLRKYLQQIPTSAIIVGMAMNVAVLMCFGARLAAILDAKIFPCFLITITGMTFNSLLPFRLGEGVKLYCGGALFRLPVGGLGAAIVMEKLYDLLMLLLLLATLIANAHLPFVNIGSPQILGLAVAAPLCGLLIFRARGAGIKVLSRLAILERFGLSSIVEQAGILFIRHLVVHDGRAALPTSAWRSSCRRVPPLPGVRLLCALSLRRRLFRRRASPSERRLAQRGAQRRPVRARRLRNL